MIIFCILYSVFCILLFAGCKKQEEEKVVSPKEVAIKINVREITHGEFQDTFKRLFLEGAAAEIKDEELKNLKMALVNQFIEEELILEEAKILTLDVKDNEVSRETEEIKKEYAGEGFESNILSKYGSMDKWKEEIRKKMLLRKVIDKAIGPRITVKEDEARRYYKEHIADYKRKEQARARMIVVKTEEEANQVKERLKKGEDFARLAQEISLGPEGKKGGDLGFFGRGEMPKEFEDVVFPLPAGKLSEVIKTPYGYHIFRVEEKREAKDLKFSEVKDQIINKLKREKGDAEFQAWMTELKQGAKIEVKEELL
ncbi:MAG: peptidyl-prolyl cis-trans isomerase [Deltaproteobacteria bacterium]|nr:peptidyl-prolyl cis-trans isomerase [Deltaproteobacteria bacterium]